MAYVFVLVDPVATEDVGIEDDVLRREAHFLVRMRYASVQMAPLLRS